MIVEGGGVTTFRVSKWYSLFIFTTVYFTRKSTTFIKQNLQLGFGLNRWKLGATELLWPYKWHGSLPGADPLQLSPLPGSSCCECSCQLYSIHHGQSLYTQWSFCINKSLKKDPLYLRMIMFLNRKYHLNTLQCILNCCKFSRSVDRT